MGPDDPAASLTRASATPVGSNRWPKAASRAALGPVSTARAALASCARPANRSGPSITAEPKGAPAAMARDSPVAAPFVGAVATGRGRTASGATRIRYRSGPALPITTSTSRSPIWTMAWPGSPRRAWAKAMYRAWADLPRGRAVVVPLDWAQAPLKARTWPVSHTRAAGSAMASSMSTATSLDGLTVSARRKPNRPIRAIRPAVTIRIMPGPDIGLALKAG